MVSIIIPARNEIYLEKTIRNVLENAQGEIEVIVELDGYVPDPQIDMKDDRILFVHNKDQIGQRACINHGVSIAKGEFIMKLDAHCAVGKGFDVILSNDCEYSWTMVPTMYNLDIATWLPKLHKKTNYMYIGCDSGRLLRAEYYGNGIRQPDNDKMIDDTMCCMGPGWFMHKNRFLEQDGCDEKHEGGWGQQGVEVSCKAWLSGGALKVNKKTWFAHWFRGGGGPGFPYKISGSQIERVREYSRDLWLNNKWEKQTRQFQWLIDKFNPPGWNGNETSPLKFSRGSKVHRQWAKISSVVMQVDYIWSHREDFCDPRKRNNLKEFKESFPFFLNSIIAGEHFTDEQLERLPYFQYLVNRLNPADRSPLTNKGRRHVIRLMRSTETLYHDIKTSGLRNPLDMWCDGDKLVLHRGGRRLEILHSLGYKTVPIRLFKSKADFILYNPDKEIVVDKSIHTLGMKQFQRLRENATDKYWVHDYLRLYDRHIGYCRERAKKVLEIGVFRGASLLLWKDAFPNAEIYGVDKNTAVWKTLLSGETRIKVFTGRQENADFMRCDVIPSGPFDLIIDDGSHDQSLTATTFELLWESVTPEGWYVVEDLFGNYKNDKSGGKMMAILKEAIDKMNLHGEIKSLHFYYNICFVQKNRRRK